jgi:hypothetical protein
LHFTKVAAGVSDYFANRLRHRHSGPQGKVVPLTIIDDPADWKASEWTGREEDYTYRFTPQVHTPWDMPRGLVACWYEIVLGLAVTHSRATS